MNFDAVIVEDGGFFWVVSKVVKYDYMVTGIGEHFLKITPEAAKEASAAIESGFLVTIPKNLSREITLLDLDIKRTDELSAKKQVAKNLVHSYLTKFLESLSIIDVYAYTAIFSKFASRGIFITDENVDKVKEIYKIDKESLKDRDDAYVDIILSNSDEDIKDLETLVDAQDKMKRVYEIYKEVRDITKSIDKAETIKEVETIKNGFFNRQMFPGE